MALTLCDLLVQGLHLIPKLLILLPKLFNHLKFDRSLKIIISAQAILSTFTLIEPLVFSQLLTWYPHDLPVGQSLDDFPSSSNELADLLP